MAPKRDKRRKNVLDKDLARFSTIEEAGSLVTRDLLLPGLGFILTMLVASIVAFKFSDEPGVLALVTGAAIAIYMAMNIGANDVANNVGPSFGARVISLGGALSLAAFCEIAGAFMGGSAVISTIAGGIIDPAHREDLLHTRVMLVTLLAAALWVHLANWIRAPVSTTHAIVGALVGAGLASFGFEAILWGKIGMITLSWITTPLFGGVIAALMLATLDRFLVQRTDKLAAARLWIPLMVAAMVGSFCAFLASGGSGRFFSLGLTASCFVGLLCGGLTWIVYRPAIERQSATLENRKASLKVLFRVPLVLSAALLSFSHGASDVANAIGPLAAITHNIELMGAASIGDSTPFWVMAIGAIGLSAGILLFGSRLVRVVGGEITKLNAIRAFCIALSTALVVLTAAMLGLPVSSTHIAVGAVFGVGFFREWRDMKRARQAMLGLREEVQDESHTPRLGGKYGSKPEIRRRKLVRRAHLLTIAGAWATTVPGAAVIAAFIVFFLGVVAPI
ncbi:inorganic phosphate transporter [Limoniibacter endophyticus]|uniref:Phosphate transporter n=1 Tax=Limoniibacter endophyticus TaxID=1565040 RepID=A0A8J3DK93_9HYPH|nr:inorganic phosphate transporter [Limoniibacter endophyticus]GHC75672.1 phosphate transporter [Limoniibacter endophyticus]